MIDLSGIQHLLQTHGLLVLAPIAVLEGPIVTVVGGSLARLGYFGLLPFFLIAIAADLIGDILLYWLGRSGQHLLPERVRKAEPALIEHYKERGGRTLLVAKLTHSLGFVALIAAGAARMPVASFLWYNLLGTIPKTLFFTGLGYFLGGALTTIDSWIFRGSLLIGVVLIAAGGVWFIQHRRRLT